MNRNQAQTRLRQLREQRHAARERRAHLRLQQDQFMDRLSAGGRTPADLTDNERAEAEGLNRQFEATVQAINDSDREERGLLSILGESAADPSLTGDGPSALDAVTGGGGLSAEQLHELQSWAPRENDHMNLAFEIATPEQAARLLRSGGGNGLHAAAGLSEADTAGGQRQARYPGVLPELRRPTRILDLVPTAPWPTEPSKGFDYWRRDGGSLASGGTAAAREWNEDAIKASGEVYFTGDEVDAATVAVWTKVKKTDLADVPAMAQVLNELLAYDLRLRIEAQVLAGNGTGANIRGILNTSGIGSIGGLAEDNFADALLNASTDVELGNGHPTAAVVNPRNLRDALKIKASDGHYLFGSRAEFVDHTGADAVVSSVLMDDDHSLVGDWALGATLFVREGIRILVSDSDQDDFVRNRVTVLCESRVALAVFYPEVFEEVDLTTS